MKLPHASLARLLACIFPLGGCGSGAIKAYEGPDRPGSELAVVQGKYSRDDSPVASDVQIGGVDGVEYPPRKYEARMLPGQHRIMLRVSVLGGSRKYSHSCIVELLTLPGCTYQPYPPSPPTRGGASAERIDVAIPVTITCTEGAFAVRAAGQCASGGDLSERPKP